MQYKTFANYIKQQEDKLKSQHPEISASLLAQIAPKEYIPSKADITNKGVLLIHGLLDSSTSMDSLYDSFSKKNYHVKNILLPGHGTTPNDLLHVTYQDWLECVEFSLNSFPNNINDITIIGLSAGAILGCYLAQNYKKVSRLILFAPAFELKAKGSSLISPLHKFNELVPPLAVEWLVSQTETSATKYKSVTTNCAHQLSLLIKLVKNKPLHCPIFTVISTDDETVSSAGTIKLLLKQKHHQNKLIIYSNGKVKQPLPKSTKCITSCIPSEQILNFSHVSMHIAPEHPIYGQKKSNNDFVLGALTNQNKSNYTNKLLRLTYNPYYNDLLKKISLFINEPP